MSAGHDSLEWLDSEPLAGVYQLKLSMLSEGREVHDLSMINPDLAPPRMLLDRLVEASLKPSNHRYAVSRGVRKLREGFARKYQSTFGVTLDPEHEICATMGVKDALLQALRSVATPGGRILIGKPTYPGHLSAARLAGLECDFFELCADESKMLAQLTSLMRTRSYDALVLNFPNNPTGMAVSREFYGELLREAERSSTFVLNDYVYGEMTFSDTGAPSLLSAASGYSGRAEIYSMSKAYSIAGWRIGAICGDSLLIDRVARLKSHIDYGTFLPLQIAAAAGLSSEEDLAAAARDQYRQRAEKLVSGLRHAGWQVEMPSAGASVWAEVPAALCERLGVTSDLSGSGSFEFMHQLLSVTGVVALPGSLFGAEFGSFVRFALVQGGRELQEVISLLSTAADQSDVNQIESVQYAALR